MSIASRRLLALVGVSLLTLTTAQAQSTPAAEGAGTTLPPVTISPPAARRAAPVRAAPEPVVRRTVARPQRPLGRTNTTARSPAPSSDVPVLPPVQLDQYSATSTKTDTPAIDILGGASVVTQDQIQQIQPTNTSELLQQVPGVNTASNPNSPAQAINIRGMQDFGRVNVLVDGARQNFQVTGHGAQSTFFLDPALIGGVDITRGPVSTIYGSGAIGGVVAFRTKGIDDILKPEEMAGVEQTIGGGTNGTGFLNSTAAGFRLPDNAVNAFGQFVLRNSYNYKDGAGIIIPDTGSELRAGNFKVNVNPAEGHQLSATAVIQKYDFTNNGTSSDGARFGTNLDTQTYTLGYRFNPADNKLFDLNVKGYYSRTNQLQTFISPDADGLYTELGAVPGSKIRANLETRGFDIYNTSRFDTGPISHALTFGGDGVFDKVHTTDNAGGYTSALTPSGERQLLGAFIQDEMRYDTWLRAVAAARYDTYELKGGPYKSDGDRISPRGTIGISPFPWIEFYGTYAEGYRAPTITETLISGVHPFPAFTILPNPTLKPETAHNTEGGVNIKLDDILTEGDKFRGKVVAFQNRVDNYIDMTGVGPIYYLSVIPGAFFNSFCAGRTKPYAFCQIPIQNQQYVNIAKADITGIEAEGAYDWGRGFASAFYSHTDGKNKTTGEDLTTIAPDKVGGALGLRFLDNKLTIGTRVTHFASRLNVNGTTPTYPAKAYTLVDLFASYQYNDWVRGDLTLANIGNVRYIRYLDLNYSPGFQARGSLTIKFATR